MSASSTPDRVPSEWCDDVSSFSLEEAMLCLAENRAWGKELRQQNDLLVNSRLAKTISQEDYLAGRKLTSQKTEECRRRSGIIERQVRRRTHPQIVQIAQ